MYFQDVAGLTAVNTTRRTDSFQSRDWLEELEGKTSIELLHKRVSELQICR